MVVGWIVACDLAVIIVIYWCCLRLMVLVNLGVSAGGYLVLAVCLFIYWLFCAWFGLACGCLFGLC